MKVIKSGTGQKGWSKKTTCTGEGNGGGGCRAVLLVEQDDLFRTSSSDYVGGIDYFDTFECPECGVRTDIKGLPGEISSKLLEVRNWAKARNS